MPEGGSKQYPASSLERISISSTTPDDELLKTWEQERYDFINTTLLVDKLSKFKSPNNQTIPANYELLLADIRFRKIVAENRKIVHYIYKRYFSSTHERATTLKELVEQESSRLNRPS